MAQVSGTAGAASARDVVRNPWVQLVAGVICMAMIANLQYGWTAFVDPMARQNGWSRAAIQVSFTIFVLVETWLVPFEAVLVDRYGPRIMVAIGGVLAGLGWVVNASAHSLFTLYVGAVLAGIGAGIVYGTSIGNALKWFAGRRGLAAGFTSAGFGAGAALTVIPLTLMIKQSGYQHTFLFFGVLQGLVILAASMLLATPPKAPPEAAKINPRVLQSNRDSNPGETLRSPVFWVMYVMFVLTATGGLTAIAQLGPIANDRYINNIPVTMLGITLPALTYALSLNNIMNGFSRPLLGFVSDRIGRELTLFGAFTIEGCGIFALMKFGFTPIAFVLLSGLVFFAWGEIFSIFPAMTRDHFGQKFATTNYGMLYTAKGTASLLVPLASVVTAATGSWSAVLFIATTFDISAALIAILILRPLRAREIKGIGSPPTIAPTPATTVS